MPLRCCFVAPGVADKVRTAISREPKNGYRHGVATSMQGHNRLPLINGNYPKFTLFQADEFSQFDHSESGGDILSISTWDGLSELTPGLGMI